jgi:hypothetical protein
LLDLFIPDAVFAPPVVCAHNLVAVREFRHYAHIEQHASKHKLLYLHTSRNLQLSCELGKSYSGRNFDLNQIDVPFQILMGRARTIQMQFETNRTWMRDRVITGICKEI